MSCILMGSTPLSAIADYIAYLLSYGYSYKGMEAPEGIAHALYEDCYNSTFAEWQPDKIYEKLYRLNQKAYCGRYETPVDIAIPPYEPTNICKRCEWNGQTFDVEEWHYQMANRIACFNYNCTEDCTRNDELHLAMIELQNCLFSFIVFNNPIFNNHKWGT